MVFNPDTEREAIYTTSRRSADFAANDFVAFEAVADAARAAVRISDQLGEMPVVDAVDPRRGAGRQGAWAKGAWARVRGLRVRGPGCVG